MRDITCACTSRTCARSWSPTRLIQSTSSRCPVLATSSWIIVARPRRECLHDAPVHLFDGPRTVHLAQQATPGVILQNRRELLLECVQARGGCAGAIVGASAHHGSPGKPMGELARRHVEVDRRAHTATPLLQPSIQPSSLFERTWEPV